MSAISTQVFRDAAFKYYDISGLIHPRTVTRCPQERIHLQDSRYPRSDRTVRNVRGIETHRVAFLSCELNDGGEARPIPALSVREFVENVTQCA